MGGAAMHWLGAVPRMHAEDFATERYGYGRSWPIDAQELQSWYARAEFEIGVAGNADDQRAIEVVTDPDYVYPMHQIPASYIDRYCQSLDGTPIVDDLTSDAASCGFAACRRPATPPRTPTTPRSRTGRRAPSDCPTTASAAWATRAVCRSARCRRSPTRCASRPVSRRRSRWPRAVSPPGSGWRARPGAAG
ncbi:hypothetical protein ACFQ0M_47185 [Kitasatospora aburaviensis]